MAIWQGQTDPCINQNDLDNFIYKEKITKSLEFLHPSIALLTSDTFGK
jgi:hypothetical protein